MADVTIRELRNRGGEVVDRVVAGEVLTVTRDGIPVARLSPLPGRALLASVLLDRWRHLPPLDARSLRRDLDRVIDPSAVSRHEQGLLDTSAVIGLEHVQDVSMLPERPLISAITLAELSVGSVVASEAERAARIARLQQVEADFDPLPFDAPAARAFGRVAASLRRAGRKPAARAYDAMIAAVAIANGLPLYTCNPRDFAGIDGLEVVSLELRA